MRERVVTRALLVGVFLFCQACAGRAPQLVDVVQSKDRNMDCAAIFAEVQANNQRVQELANEQGDGVGSLLRGELAARVARVPSQRRWHTTRLIPAHIATSLRRPVP